jgi:N6-L-threonylcarbamoyladenine synthase
MIAWAGIERYKINLVDDLTFISKARWPLDKSAPFMKGPGLKL